jgi:hypothetical protein
VGLVFHRRSLLVFSSYHVMPRGRVTTDMFKKTVRKRALVQARVDIYGVHVEEPSLERIFLEE